MRYYAIAFACLLIHGVAAKEKQIKLEDIERDNLASERKTNGDKNPGQQYFSRPQTSSATPTPKMQYGFVPMKTPPNYQPQQQQYQQYITQPQVYQQQGNAFSYLQGYNQPQQYVAQKYVGQVLPQQYSTQDQKYLSHIQSQQYTTEEQKYASQLQPQQYSTQDQKYVSQLQPQQYSIQDQKYTSQVQPQQYSTQDQKYVSQVVPQEYTTQDQVQPQQYKYVPETQPQQFRYTQSEYPQGLTKEFLQQYAQQQAYQPQDQYTPSAQTAQQPIQYIVDNQLQQTNAQPQKYYSVPQVPQYVYVQPYQAASNSIQSVTDPKGNVQYVMYLPANYLKGDPNYESLLQSYPQGYTQDEQSTQTQYVYDTETPDSDVKYAPEAGIKYAQDSAAVKYSPGIKYTQDINNKFTQATGVKYPQDPTAKYHQDTKYTQAPSVKYSQDPNPKYIQETGIKYAPESPQQSPAYSQLQYGKVSTPEARRQPTSLLDSYVPSYLQYQYYKQQESVNAIKPTLKLSPLSPVGKGEVVKNFRNVQDQSGSHVSYRHHHPATYLPHNVKH